MKNHFFVYGSLLPGLHNRGVIEKHITAEIPGMVNGYNMFDLGSFPMLRPGNGQITGTIVTVNDNEHNEVLKRLDRLEAYQENRRDNLYERVTVTAVSDTGETVNCWVYVGADRLAHQASEDRLIASGDWLKFFSEKYPKSYQSGGYEG